MAKQLTIGEVARRTGLSTRTIRFYEQKGCIPAVGRSGAGYRIYTEGDVWRLRLVRHVRLLGLPLAQIRPLIAGSLDARCDDWSDDLAGLLRGQKEAISRQIEELESLREAIDVLTSHVEHCECEPGQTVADCLCCTLIQEEGGEPCD